MKHGEISCHEKMSFSIYASKFLQMKVLGRCAYPSPELSSLEIAELAVKIISIWSAGGRPGSRSENRNVPAVSGEPVAAAGPSTQTCSYRHGQELH
jgi:hypothetical protein